MIDCFQTLVSNSNCAATPGADAPRHRHPHVPRQQRGRAVQVYPIRPTLKPPRAKCVKLEYDELPSHFAFKFNLRHYSVEEGILAVAARKVRRCRLTLSNPR
jgi:hypothetical protein